MKRVRIVAMLFGLSTLMLACNRSDDTAAIKKLKNMGIGLNPTEDEFVHHVVAEGDTTVINFVLSKGMNPNAKCKHGDPALNLAAAEGHIEAVNVLLKGGADVNGSNKTGITALMRASEAGYIDIMKLLLEAGADVNASTDTGFTALMRAILINGHPDIIKILIAAKSDLDAENTYGFTALKYAERLGYPDLISKLKEAGAKR